MNNPLQDAPALAKARRDFTLPGAVSGWRARLLGLRHGHAVGLITALSIMASLLVTWLIVALRGRPDELTMSLITAVVVPLLVAPLMCHNALRLLYEVEEARANLQQAAIRDSLTRAYNRRFFMARLEDEVLRARRSGLPLSLLMVDIDHFKAVNDAHGHAAGDAVLEQIADLLIQFMRPYDLVARYGGEEFVALMPGADLQKARSAAERVRTAIQAMRVPWEPAECLGEGAVTASLGCSCLGNDQDTPRELLERADRAMYAAKRSGRNRCVDLPPDPANGPGQVLTVDAASRE